MVGRLPLLLQQLQLRVGLRRRLPDRAGELIGETRAEQEAVARMPPGASTSSATRWSDA